MTVCSFHRVVRPCRGSVDGLRKNISVLLPGNVNFLSASKCSTSSMVCGREQPWVSRRKLAATVATRDIIPTIMKLLPLKGECSVCKQGKKVAHNRQIVSFL